MTAFIDSKEKNFEVKEVLNKKPVATEIEEKTEIPKKGKKK